MTNLLTWSAGTKSQQVLDALGRTEDVMFSPSGRRVALAGYRVDRIVVFDLKVELRGAEKSIRLTDVVEIEAHGLQRPHGLCFLDEDTLAVANRIGSVEVLAIPGPSGQLRHRVTAQATLVGADGAKIETPGSLAARALDAHTFELLVCNNYANTVTRHVLDRRNGLRVIAESTLLADGLATPDGICISPDGRWIAVSNHDTHSVLLYDRGERGQARGLGPHSEPDGVLHNVLCPHGVRFTDDMEHVLVADAGAPFVNVYARGDGDWHGERDPSLHFPAIGNALFLKGQSNPQEGGPKGLHIDPRHQVLVTTCETQNLAFFDLADVLCQGKTPTSKKRRLLRYRVVNAVYNRVGWMRHRAL